MLTGLLLYLFLEERRVRPKLQTDTPLCPTDQLACGNSVCIDRALFCNGEANCEDGSDENACGK